MDCLECIIKNNQIIPKLMRYISKCVCIYNKCLININDGTKQHNLENRHTIKINMFNLSDTQA